MPTRYNIPGSITAPSTKVWCIGSFALYPELVQEYQNAEQAGQAYQYDPAERERQDEIAEQQDEQAGQAYQYDPAEQA